MVSLCHLSEPARKRKELVIETEGEAAMAVLVWVEPIVAAREVHLLFLMHREEAAEGVGVDYRNGPYC